jgi:hypothetical protein
MDTKTASSAIYEKKWLQKGSVKSNSQKWAFTAYCMIHFFSFLLQQPPEMSIFHVFQIQYIQSQANPSIPKVNRISSIQNTKRRVIQLPSNCQQKKRRP